MCVGVYHQGLTRKTAPSSVYSEGNLLQGTVFAGNRGAENQKGVGEVTQRLERAGNHYILRLESKVRGGDIGPHGLGPPERSWNQSGAFQQD